MNQRIIYPTGLDWVRVARLTTPELVAVLRAEAEVHRLKKGGVLVLH